MSGGGGGCRYPRFAAADGCPRRVLLDLLRMNVAPLAVFQVLKSMCAGQRLPSGPEAGPPAAPAPLPADTRGRRGAGSGRTGRPAGGRAGGEP